METHKYIQLTGEVIYRTPTYKIPGKHYKSAYFTVKCKSHKQLPDHTFEETDDYFSIHTFKESQIELIREGFIISCVVRRDGRLWLKDGQIQRKNDYRMINNEKVFYGSYPIVFDSYHLIGEIEVLNNKVDREEIKNNNDIFKDDLPF